MSGAALGWTFFETGCFPDLSALGTTGTGGGTSSTTTSSSSSGSGSGTTTATTTTSTSSTTSSGTTGCTDNSQCPGQVCANGACVDQCADSMKDGNETDTDCGGGVCGACDTNLKCRNPSDCKTGICSSGTCVDASCSDGIKDQNETGVDCGGICVPAKRCPTGTACAVASDCESFLCNNNLGTCDPPDVVAATDMIDDMEDDHATITPVGGRIGAWFVYNDGTATGMQVPHGPAQFPDMIPGARGASVYAQHSAGQGFTSWGAGIGFDFNNPSNGGTTKQPYDASGYSGIKFWGRSDNQIFLTFQVADKDTYSSGGVCTKCDDHFSTSVKLQKEWALYKVLFGSLQQGHWSGYDQFPAFNPAQVIAVQIQTPTSAKFDYWIDDVAFFR